MKLTSTLTVVGAALLLASAGAAQSRTSGSGIRISKGTPAVSTTPSTTTRTLVTSGDVELIAPFDLSFYANKMNEKNITAHMSLVDSLEIQLGQLGQAKAMNNSVRNFATMLVNDHSAHLGKTFEIITDEDVGAEPLASDPEALRMRQTLADLRNMPSSTNWDAAFLRFQVLHHQHEIDILNANIKNAHDDDLEEHIEASLRSLAKHRDMAVSIAMMLGVTIP